MEDYEVTYDGSMVIDRPISPAQGPCEPARGIHVLRCGHRSQRANETACSSLCLEPRWGVKDYRPRRCRVCAVRDSEHVLTALLLSADQEFANLCGDDQEQAHEIFIAWLNDEVRRRICAGVWRRYHANGPAAFIASVLQRVVNEEADYEAAIQQEEEDEDRLLRMADAEYYAAMDAEEDDEWGDRDYGDLPWSPGRLEHDLDEMHHLHGIAEADSVEQMLSQLQLIRERMGDAADERYEREQQPGNVRARSNSLPETAVRALRINNELWNFTWQQRAAPPPSTQDSTPAGADTLPVSPRTSERDSGAAATQQAEFPPAPPTPFFISTTPQLGSTPSGHPDYNMVRDPNAILGLARARFEEIFVDFERAAAAMQRRLSSLWTRRRGSTHALQDEESEAESTSLQTLARETLELFGQDLEEGEFEEDYICSRSLPGEETENGETLGQSYVPLSEEGH